MINLGLISKSSQRLMHNLAHLLLSFQKRSRVQGASRACVEPLRFDELREERVHGSVAELLQICELQTFCRDRVLSVQVRRKEMKNIKKKKKNSRSSPYPIARLSSRQRNRKKKKFYKSTTHTVVEKIFFARFSPRENFSNVFSNRCPCALESTNPSRDARDFYFYRRKAFVPNTMNAVSWIDNRWE